VAQAQCHNATEMTLDLINATRELYADDLARRQEQGGPAALPGMHLFGVRQETSQIEKPARRWATTSPPANFVHGVN